MTSLGITFSTDTQRAITLFHDAKGNHGDQERLGQLAVSLDHVSELSIDY